MSDHDKDAAAHGAAAFMKLAKHFGFGVKDPSDAGFVSAVVSKEEMADRVMAKIKETARKKPVMPFISADDGEEIQPVYKAQFVSINLTELWLVENKCSAEEINLLHDNNKMPTIHGHKFASGLHQQQFGKSDDDVCFDAIPYSPYSEKGAAFCVAACYEWKTLEDEYQEKEKARQAEEMEREAQRYRETIAKVMDEKVKEAMAGKVWENAAINMKETYTVETFRELFQTQPIKLPASDGISKIAGALARGELKKSKF